MGVPTFDGIRGSLKKLQVLRKLDAEIFDSVYLVD